MSGKYNIVLDSDIHMGRGGMWTAWITIKPMGLFANLSIQRHPSPVTSEPHI